MPKSVPIKKPTKVKYDPGEFSKEKPDDRVSNNTRNQKKDSDSDSNEVQYQWSYHVTYRDWNYDQRIKNDKNEDFVDFVKTQNMQIEQHFKKCCKERIFEPI